MRFMKPLTLVSLTMLSLGGASLVSSCAENRSSFFISHVVYQSPEDECGAEADPSGAFVAMGTLDLLIKDEYIANFLLANQLRPLGDRNTLKTETSRIQVEGFQIALSGPGVSREYTVPASGTVSPDNSEPGYATFPIRLVNSGVIREAGIYEFEVTAYGRTLGGIPMETGIFTFSVEACRGCLAACPPTADLVDSMCRAYRGQDNGVDCLFYPGKECPSTCG